MMPTCSGLMSVPRGDLWPTRRWTYVIRADTCRMHAKLTFQIKIHIDLKPDLIEVLFVLKPGNYYVEK